MLLQECVVVEPKFLYKGYFNEKALLEHLQEIADSKMPRSCRAEVDIEYDDFASAVVVITVSTGVPTAKDAPSAFNAVRQALEGAELGVREALAFLKQTIIARDILPQ